MDRYYTGKTFTLLCKMAGRPISFDDWANIIQARAEEMRRVLFECSTLQSVGDLNGGPSPGEKHPFKDYATITNTCKGDKNIATMSLQGVFGPAHIKRVSEIESLTDQYWGFTRGGEWVRVTSTSFQGQVAESIFIETVSLPDLLRDLQNPPDVIWDHLRSVVRTWLGRHKAWVEQADRVDHAQEMEDRILDSRFLR